LPDQVVAVVELGLGFTSHFLFFSRELNSTQLTQELIPLVSAFSPNSTHHEIILCSSLSKKIKNDFFSMKSPKENYLDLKNWEFPTPI
jgi:hypothetical protein